MARKKTSKIPNRSSEKESEVESAALTDTNVTSSVYDMNGISITVTEMEDKLKEFIEELEAKKTYLLTKLNISFDTFLLSVPRSVLEETVDMDDENLRQIIKNTHSPGDVPKIVESPAGTRSPSPIPAQTTNRRRSRSVREMELHGFGRKKIECGTSKKRRSSSLDMYKTPKNKTSIQAFTSAKKYTVSKPVKAEDSGIIVKRLMKPDEEAISITGSPLLVQPTVASAPTVNIPLPGGVVMNILPKRPQGNFEVPELDENTRQQLKMLCQQLNNLF